MELLENHVRALWRYLNHGNELSDLRCIDVNQSRLLDRSIVRGEEAVVDWARKWNGKGNCFIGRNPRHLDGSVSSITTYSYDLDPNRPKGTAADEGSFRTALQAGRLILQESPAGYLASSGNGALVLYRLAVPVREDFKAFDSWLASREDHYQQIFSTRGLNVKCDHTHDAARIVKLLGTTSTKGDRALWRVSRFIDLPGPSPRLHSPDLRLSEPDCEGVEANAARAEAMAISSYPGGTGPTVAVEKDGRGGARPVSIGTLAERIETASRALARLAPKRRDDYQLWLQVGMSLTELGIVGLQLWETWSRPSTKFVEGICATKWKTFKANPAGGKQCSIGSLLHWAELDDPQHDPNIVHTDDHNGADSSIDAFMADIHEPAWLARPYIARGAIGFVAGLPETMKTWLTMDLAVELARGGGNWLGLFPVEGGRAVFIDQERDKSETQRRFKSICTAKGLTFAMLRDKLFIRNGSVVQFDDPDSVAKFEKYLDFCRPNLVIIDSFSTIHSKNENNKSEMQPLMERVKDLRAKFGCAFIFIDHENKSVFTDQETKAAPTAFRMSGSVGKVAAGEFALTVRRFDRMSSIVHHTKSTLGVTGDSFSASLMDVENGIVVKGQK